ncbi:MAG: hypothetical protein CFE37_09700 [Alphaproteobacteria bacterium PA4]|nr:MAG: hypothetical protein CFE37_09700 [Alphaproteobacteria bacterium PA4]
MASNAKQQGGAAQRLIPNGLLAILTALLALAALLAIARGRPQWGLVPPLVWLHLVSILTATVLTPLLLMRRKGDGRHRQLGSVWASAMLVTAATSLAFATGAPRGWGVFTGDFSLIHILSVIVLIQVPRTVLAARRHDRNAHERGIRGVVIGALLIAGFFTFPFERMLGSWLFG